MESKGVTPVQDLTNLGRDSPNFLQDTFIFKYEGRLCALLYLPLKRELYEYRKIFVAIPSWLCGDDDLL